MSNAKLIDRRLLYQRRQRAYPNAAQHDFLYTRVAEDLVDRLNLVNREFDLCLEIGAHTGQLTRLITEHKNIEQLIVSDPVFEFVRPLSVSEELSDLRVVADEEFLPFAQGKFDLALSCLNFHLINDLPGTLIQIRRALKPDGLLMAAMLGAGSLVELRDSLSIAETELYGGISPRILPFADVRDIGALLQRAGFALPVVDLDKHVIRYANPVDLVMDLRNSGLANMLTDRNNRHVSRKFVSRALEIYREKYQDTDGRVPASISVIHLQGWAPHSSQQKPMKPGSAQYRLTDALKAIRDNKSG